MAAELLRTAELIAVTLPALCEFVWVLTRGYRRAASEVLGMIRSLLDSATVQVDRPAVEAGLAVLEAGGDFAEGVIAFDGRRLGGEVFGQLRSQGSRIDRIRERRGDVAANAALSL